MGGHLVCVILLTPCTCMNQEVCLSQLIKLNEIGDRIIKECFLQYFSIFFQLQVAAVGVGK